MQPEGPLVSEGNEYRGDREQGQGEVRKEGLGEGMGAFQNRYPIGNNGGKKLDQEIKDGSPIGIGVLTTHRVLFLIYRDFSSSSASSTSSSSSSSSSLLMTNAHTHTSGD